MNIELPRDAEGREIPLNTEILYDKNGGERKVYQFTFPQATKRWMVELKMPCGLTACLPENYWLVPPDSLERLNEDLSRVADFKVDGVFSSRACAYVGSTKDLDCACCKFGDSDDQCDKLALKDIATRMNRLCGDSE